MRLAFLLLDAEVTGGQVIAHELMRAARDRGHQTLAIVPAAGPMVQRFEADRLPVRVLPLTRSFRLDQALTLARVLRRERIDLLNTHTLFVGNQLGQLAGGLAGVPVVAHSHIDELFSRRRIIAAAQRAVNRRTAERSAAIVAVSNSVKQSLLDEGIRPEIITVIHNGVRIEPMTERTGNAELRLVCAARLAPIKGQSILLEALAEVPGPVFTTFVGDDIERGGAYRAELESIARRLGVAERVEFAGRRDDLRRLIEQSDALVLPSLAEGLPLVALEAMERGRAVIATTAGGTPELVADGETGLLVTPRSVSELTQAIQLLSADRELVDRLGAAGRSRVERFFTVEAMADRTLLVFAQADERPRRRTSFQGRDWLGGQTHPSAARRRRGRSS